MSNRIQPTHNWEGDSLGDGIHTFATYSYQNNDFWYFTSKSSVTINDVDVAGFKIRPKTPQEQANSIYYPKPTIK